MDYQNALQFIKECSKFGIKLGLERMNEILCRLGNPQALFRVVHVAGTNGKGSTVAMLERVLREAGYRTGRYISPHLSSYRERFCVNGEMIAPEELAAVVSLLEPILIEVTTAGFGAPTEFEVGTALALLFFARAQVEVAVIEVGMGGRFDATNVLLPELSIITHIALDHQQYLGETLAEIAFEKAGIIKPQKPVIIGEQDFIVQQLLIKTALEREAPLRLANEIKVQQLELTETGTLVSFLDPDYGELNFSLKLIGEHQVSNARNVIMAVKTLVCLGFVITREQLVTGLNEAVWSGRFERITQIAPLKFYLDGAHNPDGIEALVKNIQIIYPEQSIDLLIGVLNNRPVVEMAEILAPLVRKVIVTNVPDPQTTPAAELAAIFANLGVIAQAIPDPELALEEFLQSTAAVGVATGSLYLTGLLRAKLCKTGD